MLRWSRSVRYSHFHIDHRTHTEANRSVQEGDEIRQHPVPNSTRGHRRRRRPVLRRPPHRFGIGCDVDRAVPTDRAVERSTVYLPLLRRPDHCRTERGTKRAPLLLAYADDSYRTVLALVSTGRASKIKPTPVPREWLQSVWDAANRSTTEKLLSLYLDLDKNGRCPAASGKYFTPPSLSRIVTAFGGESVKRKGVDVRLVAEYVDELKIPAGLGVKMDLIQFATDGQLWRCSKCEILIQQNGTSGSCMNCFCSGSLRTQNLDGTVEWQDGDHTETAAPNSWCFVKRKHFTDGVEYDNPPVSVEIQISVDEEEEEESVTETVWWFCGETESNLNSSADRIAAELAVKYTDKGVDAEELAESVKNQIAKKVNLRSMLQHQMNHLRESLQDVGLENLLDDWGSPSVESETKQSLVSVDVSGEWEPT